MSTMVIQQKYKRKRRRMPLSRIVFLVTMLSIPIIAFAIFFVYVNLDSFLIAFKSASGNWTLNNFVTFYNELISPEGTIRLALKNTLIYFVNDIAVILPISLIVSYFLYKKIFLAKGFRIIYYLPGIISGIVMIGVFKEIIKPWGPAGLIAEWLENTFGWLGFKAFPDEGLLGSSSTATWTIVFYCVWTGLGSGILLFSGAMARIPVEVLEAGKLDGVSPLREIWSIIIPLIWPTISTMLILHMTGIFTASGPILLFTNGSYDTTTISFWIFQRVEGTAGRGFYGVVSATGMVFTVAGMIIILGIRYFLNKIQDSEY